MFISTEYVVKSNGSVISSVSSNITTVWHFLKSFIFVFGQKK